MSTCGHRHRDGRAGRLPGLMSTDESELSAWFRTAWRTVVHLSGIPGTLRPYRGGDADVEAPNGLRGSVEDPAADNAVYAEIRFALELKSQRGGLSSMRWSRRCWPDSPTGREGRRGMGRIIKVRRLASAMRHAARSNAPVGDPVPRQGVVGFDIAGAEAGVSAVAPSRRVRVATRANNARFTHSCRGVRCRPSTRGTGVLRGRDRLGHGVRIADDIE